MPVGIIDGEYLRVGAARPAVHLAAITRETRKGLVEAHDLTLALVCANGAQLLLEHV